MCTMRNWIASLVTAGVFMAAVPSIAAPLPFTWNPAGASPALGGSAFTADTIYTTSFLRDVGQPDGTGAAHYIQVITGFSQGGSPVSPIGFRTLYGLYLDVTDTHSSGPPPEILRFSSINTVLKADPGNRNGAALATVSGVGFANAGPTGQADDITLATGSLVTASTFLDVVSGVLTAKDTSAFRPASGEAGFFSSPPLDGSFLLERFNSNLATFVTTPQPDGTSIVTFNGFTGTIQLVPEPGSMLLLSSGLIALLPSLRRGRRRFRTRQGRTL